MSFRQVVLLLVSVLLGARPLRGQDVANEVPLIVRQGFLTIVQGDIVGVPGPLNFVIDTGTTRTVIDRKIAHRFGSHKTGGEVRHFSKAFSVEWVSLPELHLGPVLAADIDVAVLDLSRLVGGSFRVDAIVGVDVLSRQNFTLDYGARRMIFGPPRRLKHLVPLQATQPFPTVTARVGSRSVHLLLDTGSVELTLFGDRFPPPSEKRRAEISAVSWLSVQGRIDAEERDVPRVYLGGVDLGTKALILARTPDPQRLELDGYLAIASLHAKRIAFDLEHGVLGWE